ncbi:hypothetical protein [Alkalitalea saponilacus]|uniref:Uncharacterized protein n=1 Tax=Alkalitalea saponilacus TaxID=889453 RepID=A0A1T5DDN6_9BACT|nr:hypothetical protein [Alkalitalea saponilacus]ASB50673.1 hypothetical protein CDL62_16705 [Alkalitalea saponilacus]SKB69848.1 hypothetical protein SAMN03080601_01079 [Alkalitalea saponilacus]
MKKRPDIAYLTIIGLSLTVVISVYKDDVLDKNGLFRFSSTSQHHIRIISADFFKSALSFNETTCNSDACVFIYEHGLLKGNIIENFSAALQLAEAALYPQIKIKSVSTTICLKQASDELNSGQSAVVCHSGFPVADRFTDNLHPAFEEFLQSCTGFIHSIRAGPRFS